MNSNRLYEDYFRDMADYAEKAMRFVHGVSFEDFQDDEQKIFAVVYALGVIGEAARHVPKSMREKYSDVPWKKITGMRDKVIHDYMSVDLNVVWRTVHEDLPPLRDTVKRILDTLEDETKGE